MRDRRSRGWLPARWGCHRQAPREPVHAPPPPRSPTYILLRYILAAAKLPSIFKKQKNRCREKQIQGLRWTKVFFPTTPTTTCCWPPRQSECLKPVKPAARSRRANCVNDPSAGSPTETVLRLLHPLEGSIYATSRPAPQSKACPSDEFTGPSDRLQRRAVCTRGRDLIGASC